MSEGMVDLRAKLSAHMRANGLKNTRQRELIFACFVEDGGHVSVDDLLASVQERNAAVGYATVYRTLKLLKECGLAAERHFADGQARFEKVEEEHHHDHIICERCGRIVEFVHNEIEALQEEVAHRFGFVATNHKMEIYGICQECREGRSLSGEQPAHG